MIEQGFRFNVDKLELKYSVEEPQELFNSSSIDDILRKADEAYSQDDFTFKRRTQLNLKNRAKDKFLYYKQVFSVLYKSEYVFEIYFDPFNSKLIKDNYVRVRVLNTALYLQAYHTILEQFEKTFNFKYAGYTQIDIALDIPFNIQEHLRTYFLQPDKYYINYNNRELDYFETFGKEYRNGNRDYTIYLRSKTKAVKKDFVIYNKSKELTDKKKAFLLRIINKISKDQDVYRIEIQLNERSNFNFNRFLLTDINYLDKIYTEQFNKMLDIKVVEYTRNGNPKQRCKCEKIDFLSELRAEAKKNASDNG